MYAWFRDVIDTRRSLRQAPWFFAGLTFVLALGTGANAAIFSLVQAVLLQPLPYERPQDVVMLWNARNTATNWRLGATVASGDSCGAECRLVRNDNTAAVSRPDQPREPLVYATACAITLLIAGLSSFLPARRAGALPPAVVLRNE